MSLRGLEHAIIESFVSIRRNGLMSLVSVSTLALTLGVLGAFILLILWLHAVASTLPDKLEIAVFLAKNAPKQQVLETRSDIAAMEHVKSATIIPAEIGWEEFKKNMGGRLELSGVEGNPLPDMIRVRVDDPRFIVGIAKNVRTMALIDEVNEGRALVDELVRFADLIKLLGGAAGIVLFLVTTFIISNTIRLTVFARRREIKIMQMVGATNWFIRLPLMFEGMILGAIGGALACGMIYGAASYIVKVVTKVMPLLAQFSLSVEPIQFVGGLTLVGCLVGAVGSMISIRRFLKV